MTATRTLDLVDTPDDITHTAYSELGELFISGFEGHELSKDSARFFSEAQIGGVILFAHNFESASQVARLCNQVQANRTGLPLWISVDHEGGKVQRFRKGFTRIPEAAAISALGSPSLVLEISEIIAQELSAVGINLNFCPVADIATNPANPVIGNRAFGTTHEKVSQMVSAMVKGHLKHSVQPCVKHFPGHGDTETDSHFDLPRVNTPLSVLKEREFKPFERAFSDGCAMVMTAHILNPELDPEFPATLSSKILKDILREKLGFNQLIISDDLEMSAITNHYGVDEAPRMALEAGCDLLIYRTERAARHAYASLKDDLKAGRLSPHTVVEAAKRSKRLKASRLSNYVPTQENEIARKVGREDYLKTIERVTHHGLNRS